MKKKSIHPDSLTGKIIIFLAGQEGRWCTWGPSCYMASVQSVFPVGTSEKVQLRYMQKLQKKGLVSGCDCGCRGDYTPTEKGLDFIAQECLSGETIKQEYIKGGYGFGY